MTSVDFSVSRVRMLDCQVRPSGIDDRSILRAFSLVERELFVPESLRDLSYSCGDLLLSRDPDRYLLSCSSLAILFQLACIDSSHRVLDVGCATGYSSAILSHLSSDVTAIDDDENFVSCARASLSSSTYSHVRVLHCDMLDGCDSHSPYDIILICGSIDILPQVFLSQLSSGGRIISVHGSGNSGMARVHTVRKGRLESVSHFSLSLPILPSFSSPDKFVF